MNSGAFCNEDVLWCDAVRLANEVWKHPDEKVIVTSELLQTPTPHQTSRHTPWVYTWTRTDVVRYATRLRWVTPVPGAPNTLKKGPTQPPPYENTTL